MCGRLRVGKDFLERLQHWSVQPCVRPVYAVFGSEADMKPLRLFNYIGNNIARRYEDDLILSDEEFECVNLRDFLDHQ